MLRKTRVALAFVCIVLVTLLFLDFTGTARYAFGWLAKIQFWPAVLALNIGVILALLVLTFLFGRVYCSFICPFGIFHESPDDSTNADSVIHRHSHGCVTRCWRFLSELFPSVHSLSVRGLRGPSFRCSHLTALTDVSQTGCLLPFTEWAITCWPILPNG